MRFLQVLYNIRPQAIAAADIEGTAYDVRLENSRCRKIRRSADSVRVRWPLVLGFVATVAFLLLQRYRRVVG